MAYFNQYYVNTGLFPKKIGRKINHAKDVREDSDYGDEFIPSAEITQIQIETAKELIQLVEKYIETK